MPKTRDKSYRGISPIRDEGGKIISFLVRLRRERKTHQVYVGVQTHGSVEAAFAHCEQVRDELERKHPRKITESSLSKITIPSSTGVRGVAHCHHPHKITGVVYESLQAQWPTVSGKRGFKKYSVGERKMEDALILARKAREDGVRQYLRDLQRL